MGVFFRFAHIRAVLYLSLLVFETIEGSITSWDKAAASQFLLLDVNQTDGSVTLIEDEQEGFPK